MRLNSRDIEKLKKIKIILFDLNGVLIEGVNLDEVCSPKFEFCFSNLVKFFKSRNIAIGVITANDEEVIEKLKQFKIFVATSSIDKQRLAEEILAKTNLKLENLLYVGDEIFDLQIMKKAGFSVVPSNASHSVKRAADYVSEFSAGKELMEDIQRLFLNFEEITQKEGS